ncbi:hypothetical protein V8F20_007632 [Naviculisporaceae sp. PSN 640]
MTSRQERMQGRMRGAGLHQVEDISFAFEIPLEDQYIEEPAPAPTPAPPPPAPIESTAPTPPVAATAPAPAPAPASGRPTPNTSAKRKQLAGDNPPQPVNIASPTTTPPIESPQNVVVPIFSEGRSVADQDHSTEAVGRPTSSSSNRLPSSALRRVSYAAEVEVRQAHEHDTQSSRRASVPLSSPAATPRAAFFHEEVGESPADAPGSGKRRRLRDTSQAIGSSTLLQRVVEELDETIEDGPPSSSPAERRKATQKKSESVRSGPSVVSTRASERRRSPRLSGGSVAGSDDLDEGPSPVRVPEESPDLSDQREGNTEVEPAREEEQQEDIAEEIPVKEAAKSLGRKRPRRSLPSHSPDLGAAPVDRVSPEPEPEPEPQPRAKRRRTEKAAASPATQKQPKTRGPKTKPKPPAKEKPSPKEKLVAKKQTTKKNKAQKKQTQARDDDGEAEDTGSVPVLVQRFTKINQSAQLGSDEEDDDIDDGILTAEIPFANRAGVNAVDVLSKLCQELIDAFLSRIADRIQAAEDNATKREHKTMATALEALREELRTRLLEHTTALDTHHALVKRVRVAQKERLALRDEIMRIRSEREQVGLQMDAIRRKHEADSREGLKRSAISSAMHDIDLAVEQGIAAPSLETAPPEQKKKAELAGLELLMQRIADQVSPAGEKGGALGQIREFNAFLERAAGVLERKA